MLRSTLLLSLSTLLFTACDGAPSDVMFFSVNGLLRDVVYDPDRDRVYIVNQTFNRVEVYDVETEQFLDPVPCGSSPFGADFTPDRQKLLVALVGEPRVAVLDLAGSAPTLASPIELPSHLRPVSVATAANGKAFVTCTTAGVYEIDLDTGSVSLRPEMQFEQPGRLGASGDRLRVFSIGSANSGADAYVYRVSEGVFRKDRNLDFQSGDIAVNSDGSLCALGSGRLIITDEQRVWATVPYSSGGFAWSPDGTRAYHGLSSDAHLGVLDVARGIDIDRIALPRFVDGEMAVSKNGKRLFAVLQGGFGVIRLDAPRPPVVEPVGALTASPGETVAVTVQAEDPNGDDLHFSLTSHPPGVTFDPATRVLRFSPGLGSTGSYTTTLLVSDRSFEISQPITFSVSPASPSGVHLPVTGALIEGIAHPNLDRAWFTNSDLNRVEVIRLSDRTRLDPIWVGSQPRGLDLSPDGSKLYVCASGREYLSCIDVATLQRTDLPTRIQASRAGPRDIGFASNGRGIYSSGINSAFLTEIDLATGAQTFLNSPTGNPRVQGLTHVQAAADRSKVWIAEPQGAFFPYPIQLHRAHNVVADLLTVSSDGGWIAVTFSRPETGVVSVFDSNLRLRNRLRGGRTALAFSGSRAYSGIHGQARLEVLDVSTWNVIDEWTLAAPMTGALCFSPNELLGIGTTGIVLAKLGTNRPPRIEPIARMLASPGTHVGTTVHVSDPDGDPVTVTASLPAGATLDSDLVLHFAPTSATTAYGTITVSDATHVTQHQIEFQGSAVAGAVVPVPGELFDVVVDEAADRVYASNPAMNRIEVIRLSDWTRLGPIATLPGPNGFDVEGSTMVVCPSDTEFVQVFDLHASTSTRVLVADFPNLFRTPYFAALTSTNRALFTTGRVGDGAAVWELTLGSLAVRRRDDAPLTLGGTMVRPAPGRQHLLFTWTGVNPGSYYVYSSSNDSFGARITTNMFNLDGDIRTDGFQVLVSPGPKHYANGTLLGSVPGTSTAAVFDPMLAVGYRHDRQAAVESFDLPTRAVLASIALPEPARGRMRADTGGRLIVISASGLTWVRGR